MPNGLRVLLPIGVAAALGLAFVAARENGITPAALNSAAPTSPALPAGNPAAVLQASAPETTGAVPASREAIRLSFAPVVKRVAPAVVNVYATARVAERSPFAGDPFFERFFGGGSQFGSPYGVPRERARASLGSGVIVDPEGLVVTNNHVVSGATEVKVALADGREYPAEVLLRDERTDLAVLKVENGGEAFPALEFADSDALQVGDLVLAAGNPFGVGQTVTSGIVSAVARTNVGITDSSFFIQTDAAINPGNSGGALVNLDGAVVGINTAIYSRSGGSIGIGFAIPSNMVRTVVVQAKAGSTAVVRPWIGALYQPVTPDIAVSLGIARPSGALVVEVDEGSPGAEAGLRAGDLILRVAAHDVADPAALEYRLAVAGTGNPVDLQVWRDGATVDLQVLPIAQPELDEDDLLRLGGRSPLTGAVVADYSASLAERLGIRNAGDGAVIVDVDPRSPAARFGFVPGDVILRAQGEDVTSAGQLQEMVAAGARRWRITVNRGGRLSDLAIGG